MSHLIINLCKQTRYSNKDSWLQYLDIFHQKLWVSSGEPYLAPVVEEQALQGGAITTMTLNSTETNDRLLWTGIQKDTLHVHVYYLLVNRICGKFGFKNIEFTNCCLLREGAVVWIHPLLETRNKHEKIAFYEVVNLQNIITHIRTLYTGQHVYDSTVEPV